jgi:rSAM/selenodomain-associated transferase 2
VNNVPTPLPTVAVVIPTLNEEVALPATLAAVCSQMNEGVRVLIADGGSTDGTKTVAKQFGAQIVETAQRGRGCQIAAAISVLQDDVILILHADMILPPQAIQRIQRWLADHPSRAGGCLGHRFNSPRIVYRWVERWDSLRARRGMSYGDQAQFFRREVLERHGGYPDQPIMEDLELSRRLMASGRPAYLDSPVIVSPRRFERLGWGRVVFINFLLRWTYRLCGPQVCRKLYLSYYR